MAVRVLVGQVDRERVRRDFELKIVGTIRFTAFSRNEATIRVRQIAGAVEKLTSFAHRKWSLTLTTRVVGPVEIGSEPAE